jgi:dihydroorotate dehydrogenase (NAD+) catalytic subunit
MKTVSTYDINLSYDANYVNGPVFNGELPVLAELNRHFPPVEFLGYQLNSTLGVPAGPLLNSAYIKLYANLGFDVLTYKTVRSAAHPSHPFPNVCVVDAQAERLFTTEKPGLHTLPDDSGALDTLSITNSFGMPSRNPAVWQADVAKALEGLDEGQLLVVSVVGTAKAGGTLVDFANDFALTAKMAKEAGAHAVEANLSCPNVQGAEGSLYQNPQAVAEVSKALKRELGNLPFMLKIGFLPDSAKVKEVVQAAVSHGARGIAAINTIQAKVYDSAGSQALPGEGRLVSGICGAAIKPAGLEMTRLLFGARVELGLSPSDLAIVGVGGVMTADDALEYYALGADGVQSGTGAMWNPYLAQEYKHALTLAAV